ncbi:homoserine O-acetyltransferase [Aeromicrobium sp. Marseille-Q0843]|uniref:Homoserine O-acetyltransferase n=1 Tax=Aeromicrobium phoceense TaxID=2754045 RepID=A0A838XFT6_9ACTN|nr:homoserine O-acetyltransferase [Aeromicrobium phoceense]
MTTVQPLGDLTLEGGEVLPRLEVAYDTWGEFTGDNAVLVLHALTGDSIVAGSDGWWNEVVGPGLGIDTDRFFVVAANILGGCKGTTGPASAGPDGRVWGNRFPAITVRDQVAAEAMLTDHLGIDRWHAVIGGSAGGMRAVEWAVTHPERVERLFLLASSAYASAEQIAWTSTQADIIRAAGPEAGLELARRIAHTTYRSEAELAERFGRTVQSDGRFAVQSYLQHHGDKLVKRFDAWSYIALGDAMNSHDVGRDRGGLEAALGRVTARTVVAAIDSDRLYPPYQQQELADLIPTAEPLAVVRSPHGHDGFLIEHDQVGALARDLLEH